MDRDKKTEMHLYCKDRERRKSRYSNKMKDKKKEGRYEDIWPKQQKHKMKEVFKYDF